MTKSDSAKIALSSRFLAAKQQHVSLSATLRKDDAIPLSGTTKNLVALLDVAKNSNKKKLSLIQRHTSSLEPHAKQRHQQAQRTHVLATTKESNNLHAREAPISSQHYHDGQCNSSIVLEMKSLANLPTNRMASAGSTQINNNIFLAGNRNIQKSNRSIANSSFGTAVKKSSLSFHSTTVSETLETVPASCFINKQSANASSRATQKSESVVAGLTTKSLQHNTQIDLEVVTDVYPGTDHGSTSMKKTQDMNESLCQNVKVDFSIESLNRFQPYKRSSKTVELGLTKNHLNSFKRRRLFYGECESDSAKQSKLKTCIESLSPRHEEIQQQLESREKGNSNIPNVLLKDTNKPEIRINHDLGTEFNSLVSDHEIVRTKYTNDSTSVGVHLQNNASSNYDNNEKNIVALYGGKKPIEHKRTLRSVVNHDNVLQSIPLLLDTNNDKKLVAGLHHIDDSRKFDNHKKGTCERNFVRLNLRNAAGSCRGARNNSKSRKKFMTHYQHKEKRVDLGVSSFDRTGDINNCSQQLTGQHHAKMGLVDPVDDYLDGVFSVAAQQNKSTAAASNFIPKCSAHQLYCKQLTVKKNNDNKGRVFFVCSLPRGEQCNHFQWADDTIEAAKQALLKNDSHSGFLARQVSSYLNQIKCLTLPELRELAQRHGLTTSGKKKQLLTRLALWVRDEIDCFSSDRFRKTDDDIEDIQKIEKLNFVSNLSVKNGNLSYNDTYSDEEINDISDETSSCDSASALSTSSEELEIIEETVASSQVFSSKVREKSENNFGSLQSTKFGNALNCNMEKKRDSRFWLRRLFGHENFRDGQEWSIQRCISGQRTLLVAPTGFGKSLCYALPAALLEGVCIVVSPLLSLMQDQLRVLPPCLPAVTLSGSISAAKMAATLDDIFRRRIKIVFVSPERLASASFRRLFRMQWIPEKAVYERIFPNVSLLCVDEAHCLSQWAHHFRPAYLRLGSLVELVQPKSVLAITATAGPRVVQEICRTLKIDIEQADAQCNEIRNSSSGVCVMNNNRDNIDVICFMCLSHGERLSKLMKLLLPHNEVSNDEHSLGAEKSFGCLALGSVIVYVWRQMDAEAVAENIRASGVTGGVVVYHGGLDSPSRQKAQSKFMRGKARICVATVAFGLGINKSDIVGVVHMNLSSSPEHYLQEIGRAGRDGRSAKAIALVLHDEVLVRHSLSYSDSVSRCQISALFSFMSSSVKDLLKVLPADRTINVGLLLIDAVRRCDCKIETIETLLSLLELRIGSDPILQVEGIIYDNATISPRRRQLEELAKVEQVAHAILACAVCTEAPVGEVLSPSRKAVDQLGHQLMEGHSFGSYSFSVTKCANYLGSAAEPRHVFAALRRLESCGEIELVLDTSPNGRALHFRMNSNHVALFRDSLDHEIDLLKDELLNRISSTLNESAKKVLHIYDILCCVSEASKEIKAGCCPGISTSLLCFQNKIQQYFDSENYETNDATERQHSPVYQTCPSFRELSSTIRSVISHLICIRGAAQSQSYMCFEELSTFDYTALTVTKFLHGIPSACFPAPLLRSHALYGRLQSVSFPELLEQVTSFLKPISNSMNFQPEENIC